MSTATPQSATKRRRRWLGALAAVLVVPLISTAAAYGVGDVGGGQDGEDSGVRLVTPLPRADEDDDPDEDETAEVPKPPLPGQAPTDIQPLEAGAVPPTPSGATVTRVEQLDPQTIDLTIDSAAMGREVPVRLLLPRDFAAQPERTFPTLYLLGGYGEPQDYKAWTFFTDAAEFFRDKNALVAMPTVGDVGFFSDWWNYGEAGGDGWETFHTEELPQILQSAYRANDRRSVAGISMGGYGAMAYAARNPGMFDAAASYSGYLHTTMPGMDRFIQFIVAQQDEDPYALWGDPILQAGIWNEHDPSVQAENLEGTELYVSAAMGMRGEHDEGDEMERVLRSLYVEDPLGYNQVTVLASSLETAAFASSQSFVQRLDALGIPVQTSFKQEGTHSWGQWEAELHDSWPMLAEAMGAPAQEAPLSAPAQQQPAPQPDPGLPPTN